ncbi:hypothetical protein Ccrd_005555 [Cynara cardunculus var. scolymus]|uniref:Uncharacterized protein n=1 Tax=Cynara cardunculus var. scolymus TaxID=59895 RepID=A0A103XKF5_CYNCS|nr:hypothetical protein Ccrd_005555 [Cynara cardunculus var. scolymus]
MEATVFFCRRSSSTFAAFFTASLEFDEPSRTTIASTIRRAARWPLVVILFKGNNLLEYEEKATIDRRSEDERDEMINLIARFIICSFSLDIFPLTSTTVTKSMGALPCVFSGITGAFALRTIAYVS